jgi:hypothetical protein
MRTRNASQASIKFSALAKARKEALAEAYHAMAMASSARRNPKRFGRGLNPEDTANRARMCHLFWLNEAATWRRAATQRSTELQAAITAEVNRMRSQQVAAIAAIPLNDWELELQVTQQS